MSVQWFARYEIFNDQLAIYARGDSFGGMSHPVAQPVQITYVETPRGQFIEPTLSLPGDEAKALFQAMWDAGMRPNNGAGSGAEAQALRSHITFAEKMASGLLQRLQVSEDAHRE